MARARGSGRRHLQLDVDFGLLPAAASRVIDVIEDAPVLLRYLDSIGIRPGAHVVILECAKLSRPLTRITARGRLVISIELARLISVESEATAELKTA